MKQIAFWATLFIIIVSTIFDKTMVDVVRSGFCVALLLTDAVCDALKAPKTVELVVKK